MPKPNYQFEKRQRELEKKRKKEEKAQRKASGSGASDAIDALQLDGGALPQRICPICGEPNECEAAASGDANTPCWCRAISLKPEVLERIPPEARGLACVCRQCAEEAMTAGPTASSGSSG